MGFVSRRKGEEQPGGGSGLHLDLDLRACPLCHRDLHPWERVCPDDGSEAVDRRGLRRGGLEPPPAHLLDEDD